MAKEEKLEVKESLLETELSSSRIHLEKVIQQSAEIRRSNSRSQNSISNYIQSKPAKQGGSYRQRNENNYNTESW